MLKYFGNISVFNEIFQNAMPFCTLCLFLPRGAMTQSLVMLNTCNCLLLVKCFLLLTSIDYLWFLFSINQIKNIETLFIWLFKLSQVTNCSKSKRSQMKSVTVADRQYLQKTADQSTGGYLNYEGPSIYDVHTEREWSGSGERGEGQALCGRPLKIRVHWRHPVFFSCKEVGVLFYQNVILGRNKKMEIFRRYNTNSTVLNKLQSYSRISALGPEGHCTRRFKRGVCISCQPHVDIHKGGSGSCGQGEGSKT